MIRQTLYLFFLLGTLTTGWFGLTAFDSIREEYGKAGYYSDALQGRKTASGEKYDKNALTAAHKSLPFGTLIRITRLDNKLSVVVRVNDRGPYREGYVVDVSRHAAEELDLIKAGSAKVKVEVIDKPDEGTPSTLVPATKTAKTASDAVTDAKPAQYSTPSTAKPSPASKTATKTAPSAADATKLDPAKTAAGAASELYQMDLQKPAKQGFGVQVTTLYNAPNVFPEVSKLQKYWPGKVLVSMQPMPEATENTVYKLILGPVTDRPTAEKLRKEAVKKGYSKCFVVDLSQI